MELLFQEEVEGSNSLNDNESFTFGTDNDLSIVHTGSAGCITNTTGNLVIDNTNTSGSTIIQLGTDTNATAFEVK